VQALMLWHQGLAMLGPSSFVDKECFVAALESMLSSPGEGQMMMSCVWTYEILHACVHHTVALVAQKRALVVITSLFFRVAGCDEILPLLDVMVKVKLTVAAIPGLVGVLCRQKDQPAVVRAVLCVLSRVQSGPGFSSLLAEAVPVLGRIGLVVYVHDPDIVMLVTKLMAKAGHYYLATVLAPWLPFLVRAWEPYPQDEELAGIVSDLVFLAAGTLRNESFVSYVPFLMRIAAAHPPIGRNAMQALVVLRKRPEYTVTVAEHVPAVVAWIEESNRDVQGVIDAMSIVLHFSDCLSVDAIARLGRVVASIVVHSSNWVFTDSDSVPLFLEFITMIQAGISCSDLERIRTMHDNNELLHDDYFPVDLWSSALPALATTLLVRHSTPLVLSPQVLSPHCPLRGITLWSLG
jgi:hypothetical protein